MGRVWPNHSAWTSRLIERCRDDPEEDLAERDSDKKFFVLLWLTVLVWICNQYSRGKNGIKNSQWPTKIWVWFIAIFWGKESRRSLKIFRRFGHRLSPYLGCNVRSHRCGRSNSNAGLIIWGSLSRDCCRNGRGHGLNLDWLVGRLCATCLRHFHSSLLQNTAFLELGAFNYSRDYIGYSFWARVISMVSIWNSTFRSVCNISD
jgi:hypothetical protein